MRRPSTPTPTTAFASCASTWRCRGWAQRRRVASRTWTAAMAGWACAPRGAGRRSGSRWRSSSAATTIGSTSAAAASATGRGAGVGMNALVGGAKRVTRAAFAVRTHNEMVSDQAVGGRNTFKNAGHTRRHGVEAEWDGALPFDLHGYAAYTWLRAQFAD